ncbi:hypothetical protein [Ruminiclostridium cellulolyticum]|uniref:Uncharacterized protein n=1 Tax=Ruminiclostridium cellulolyticum (strain ATCC 35319 / DSM 5812 / JCM 6584 / H10) TaxID=394503 RepID=B8I903_RUMCH|nr:hypothetical protein [Ruminiclostridium cellulolyticum]ACL77335.1 conserved hypothetical protein [Ruminiclostridium cellulolyticum H10]
MKATKGNKVYSVDETNKAFYVGQGYDIVDDDGNVIEQGAGKKVDLKKYNDLQEKLTKLAKENKDLKEKSAALEKENKDLKDELKKAKKDAQ